MDGRIEPLAVPVADIDRSKEFCVSPGFIADHDIRVDETMRFVQLTPPGSGQQLRGVRGGRIPHPARGWVDGRGGRLLRGLDHETSWARSRANPTRAAGSRRGAIASSHTQQDRGCST
jgi:hypothetical protein